MVFSLDLRKRVIGFVDEGMHIDKAVKIFQVSRLQNNIFTSIFT